MIYSNEHLTDLINEQYEKVRKLEDQNEKLKTLLAQAKPYMQDFTECSPNNGKLMEMAKQWLADYDEAVKE